MTHRDKEIRERVKAEADDLLFDNLQFDADMKEKVRQLSGTAQERSAVRKVRKPGRNIWFVGIAVAAALLGLLFVSESKHVISPDGTPPIGEPVNTFKDPDGSVRPTGPSGRGPRVLDSYEEASRSFGDGLLIPSYIPDGFSLYEINVTGPEEGKATDAAFSYVAGDRSFGVFAQKENADMPQSGKTVDVNGAVGYLIVSPSVPEQEEAAANVELHWSSKGIHYMLSGILTGGEAVLVARSMEPFVNQTEQ
ncbi:hypothetical protein ACFPYJ_14770 [Paenibacillus solisilvae]|uniref:DUF4367 domain-containing protein n=1 Tax=Paenibacillus solisilvae TaxID=2486751 RepID=A0ABW0VWW4_9BACL